ncbi:MAG TPA: hypothetical protein PKC96_01440 [Bacilli bacterium]|nr:hypothetical protein [Bacilli bacterium]
MNKKVRDFLDDYNTTFAFEPDLASVKKGMTFSNPPSKKKTWPLMGKIGLAFAGLVGVFSGGYFLGQAFAPTPMASSRASQYLAMNFETYLDKPIYSVQKDDTYVSLYFAKEDSQYFLVFDFYSPLLATATFSYDATSYQTKSNNEISELAIEENDFNMSITFKESITVFYTSSFAFVFGDYSALL